MFYDFSAHIRVEGVRWTRFWWYNPINGWPSSEADVLGGKLYCTMAFLINITQVCYIYIASYYYKYTATCTGKLCSIIPYNYFIDRANTVPYGACRSNATYCFGRLPGGLRESDAELLAIDSAATIYR